MPRRTRQRSAGETDARIGPRSRRLLWIPAAILLLLLLYGMAMAVSLVLARSALLDGAATLRDAQSALSLARVEQAPLAELDRVDPALARARSDFARAENRLAPFTPVLRRLGWVPVVGKDLADAPPAAQLARETAAGATTLVTAIKPVLAVDGGGRLTVAAALGRVNAAEPAIAGACSSLAAATDTRAQIGAHPSPRLVGPLHTLDRDLPNLLTLCRTLAALPGLLGANRPATYLVAYQNPNQLRAAGGFLGSAGLLTIRNGIVHQQFTGTWLQDRLTYLPPTAIGQEDGEPAWLFRDSNWSPDFPTSAALERFFVRLDLGWQVNGVIDITPQAVADALRALGPIYIPEYSRLVDAGNVAALADYYAHRTTDTGPLHTGSGDTQRKQFFGIVAQHLFARLHTLSPGTLIRLARDLNPAVQRRDLQLNFTDPRDQWLANRIGAAGRVSPTRSDYLQVVDGNISYNKINGYIRESVRYHATVLPTRWVEGDLSITYTDVAAPQYIYADSYGPGAGQTGTPADYGDFVRILVPDGASLLNQSGWLHPYPGGPAYGKTMFAGYLIVHEGETRTVHLRYLMPPNLFVASAGSQYRFLLQHQPGARLSSVHVALTADGRTRSWTVRHRDIDWSVSAPIERRPFSAIALPPNPFPSVLPGHWIEPGTYLARRL
jgi:hypothetical protein